MRKPDFIIIGAQKSGTTSLYEYMKLHPQVWFPDGVKETHFFTFWGEDGYVSGSPIVNVKTKLDEYLELFSAAPENAIVGEASPSYIYDPDAPKKIKKVLPDVSLIAVLRNPVDRAFSNYLHAVRSGRESHSFEVALELENRRIESGEGYMRHYRNKGFYGEQISRYYDVFDEGQILTILSRDLWHNSTDTMSLVFSFLGVRDDFNVSADENKSPSGVPRNRILKLFYEKKYLWRWVRKVSPQSLKKFLANVVMYRPEMSIDIAQNLLEEYESDINKLEGIIDRDLSHWKTR